MFPHELCPLAMRIDFKVFLSMSLRGVNEPPLLIDNGHIEMKISIPWTLTLPWSVMDPGIYASRIIAVLVL